MPKIDRAKRNFQLLVSIADCKRCIRNTLIQKGSKDFIEAILDCVDNLLRNNIQLTPVEFEYLKKFKFLFRKLVKKGKLTEKKKLLIQHGGFLQYLIPAAISAISALISNVSE